MFKGLDFSSDTATRPSRAMKQAMIEAELGDEQKGEDPTTKKLEQLMAEKLGKSGALFFPSATMANQVAVVLHTTPGDEVLGADTCHIFINEGGGAAFHARSQTRMIATPDGTFDGDAIKARFRPDPGYLSPKTTLVIVENTHNATGGVVWPKEKLVSVTKTAQELGLKTHLDGARLFNAALATQRSLEDLAQGFDTVTVCFSKGLGCAAGAILAFDEKQFDNVRKLKQIFGGSLRQSGMLSAACLYALKNHVDDLAEDHLKAQRFSQGLSTLKGLVLETKNPTSNMVFFSVHEPTLKPDSFMKRCLEHNIRFSQVSPNRFRAVMHRDVSMAEVHETLLILNHIAG